MYCFCEKCYKPGFLSGSDSKESTCNAGDLGSIPGLGRSPGGGNGNPLQYSCLENPHGQRSLAGCSLWGSQRVGHSWATKHIINLVQLYIADCVNWVPRLCCTYKQIGPMNMLSECSSFIYRGLTVFEIDLLEKTYQKCLIGIMNILMDIGKYY